MNAGPIVTLALLAGLSSCTDPTAPASGPIDSPPAAPTPARADPGLAYGFDVGEIKSVDAYLAEPRFAAADFKRGELLSLSCQACHTLAQGQPRIVGPNLYGIFGRQAGTVPGFAYSAPLARSGLIWTPRALDAWLAEPQRFIVGNNMAFSGFSADSDRRDLIAFLLRATRPQTVE